MNKDYLKRMIFELRELSIRISKAKHYLIDHTDDYLEEQVKSMCEYRKWLKSRIIKEIDGMLNEL